MQTGRGGAGAGKGWVELAAAVVTLGWKRNEEVEVESTTTRGRWWLGIEVTRFATLTT